MWRLVTTTVVAIWSFSATGKPATAQNPGPPAIVWTASTGSLKIDLSNPLVAGDLVIVGNGEGRLQSRRCDDGTVVWEHMHGKRIFTGLDCDANNIYFTSERGLSTVTRAGGNLLWSHPIMHGAGACAAVAAKDLVVVGGYDGFIHALDSKSGATCWKASLIADAPPDRPDFPSKRARIGDSLARPTGIECDDERVYQSVMDQSRVVAVDLATGKVLWSYQANGWIYGAPVVGGEYIFVGSQDKSLHCLEKTTGRLLWTFATKGRIESAGTVDDHSVYFASCDGCLYRVNQADGKQLWKFDTTRGVGRKAIYSKPLLTADSVYFAAGEGTVYALNRETGEQHWSIRPAGDSETFSSPVTDGRYLFLVTRPTIDKRGLSSLVAIDPDGGPEQVP